MLEPASDVKGEDDLTSEGQEASLLKRVGLSVLHSNTSFWQRSREEASEAEHSLEALRREAQLRQARCQSQLESLARDAKEEQERRLISEKVGQELAAIREEMRRKEAVEEERLRHLYRGILGPKGPASESGGSTFLPPQQKGQSSPAFTPLIVSEASLLDSEPTWDVGAVPLKGDLDLLSGKDFWPSAPAAPAPASTRDRHGGKASGRSKDMRDATKLLQVNLARLERLERCGL
ncbi:unnamed protein product [Symbiodinium sp. CCMP2456]|nr:unnamed protein product [Symbiodinium sp. CCMP2456]